MNLHSLFESGRDGGRHGLDMARPDIGFCQERVLKREIRMLLAYSLDPRAFGLLFNAVFQGLFGGQNPLPKERKNH